MIWSPSSVLSFWGQSALALAIVKGLGAAVIMVTGTLRPVIGFGVCVKMLTVSSKRPFQHEENLFRRLLMKLFRTWRFYVFAISIFFVPENATHLDLRRIKRDQKLRPGYLYMPLCALLSALIFRRHYGWLEVRRSAIAMLGGFELFPFSCLDPCVFEM